MARSSDILDEKPLPNPEATGRPGTSGTELNLRANREKASTAFQRAQRAEQAYRARRQAANARRDVQAAKEHFSEGSKQLKLGMGCAVRVVKAIPAVFREKREGRREKAEVRKRERSAEKKRVLQEKIKKAEGSDGEEAPAAATEGEESAVGVV